MKDSYCSLIDYSPAYDMQITFMLLQVICITINLLE